MSESVVKAASGIRPRHAWVTAAVAGLVVGVATFATTHGAPASAPAAGPLVASATMMSAPPATVEGLAIEVRALKVEVQGLSGAVHKLEVDHTAEQAYQRGVEAGEAKARARR